MTFCLIEATIGRSGWVFFGLFHPAQVSRSPCCKATMDRLLASLYQPHYYRRLLIAWVSKDEEVYESYDIVIIIVDHGDTRRFPLALLKR